MSESWEWIREKDRSDYVKFDGNAEVKLFEVSRWILSNRDDGCICPSCDQIVKVYRRQVYASMAASLTILYKLSDNHKWIHKTDLISAAPNLSTTLGGGDFAKMKYWGLVVEKPKDEHEDKRTSGFWKISERGVLFCENKLSIPRVAIICDGRLIGFERELVTITDCLGVDFSYKDLMPMRAQENKPILKSMPSRGIDRNVSLFDLFGND